MNKKEKTEKEKTEKELQERSSNCVKELLAVLHKYDCVLMMQQTIDGNGNMNPTMMISPIDRRIKEENEISEEEKE